MGIISASFFITILGLIFKGVIGVLCGSRALVADAVHSLTDALCFGLNYNSAYSQTKSSNERASRQNLFIGVVIVLSGVWVCANNTATLISGTLAHPGFLGLAIALISMIANWRLFKTSKCVAGRFNDPQGLVCVIQNRTNFLAACLSFSGVLLSEFGFLYFDPICAVMIGGLLVASGLEILFTAEDHSVGRGTRRKAVSVVGMITLAIVTFYGYRVHGALSADGVILVPAQGAGVAGPADAVLGRAQYFAIFNTREHTHTMVPNSRRFQSGDVSNFVVSVVKAYNVDVILVHNVGSEMFSDMQDQGVRIYYFKQPSSVQQLVTDFQRDRLELARGPNVSKGYGLERIRWMEPW